MQNVAYPWEKLDPFNTLGVKPAGLTARNPDAPPSLERSAGAGLQAEDGPPWHPDNALFWFGVLAAVTLGLVAGSTSLRVGPFKGSIAAGKP